MHAPRRHAPWVVLLLALAIMSCKDSPTEPRLSLNGTWQGFAESAGMVVTLTLTEANGTVTGNGSLQALQSLPVSVGGTFDRPDFLLTMTATGYQPVVFNGAATATRMTGTLNGSGFTDVAVSLLRQ